MDVQWDAQAGGDLYRAAQLCLAQGDPVAKAAMTRHFAAAFRDGRLKAPVDAPAAEPIRMPGRPARLELVHPSKLPRRGLGTPAGRAAFIHAIAHIELNAIAWNAVSSAAPTVWASCTMTGSSGDSA